MELMAAEPQVLSPVAMAFDEEARLFVVERSELNPATGRIRLLDDPQRQGRFTMSTLYADEVPWASAITCYDGGVFVASGSDILYLKGNSVDRKAEVRKVIFSGFGDGSGSTKSTRALLHSLTWGPDNRIYGGTAGVGGMVRSGITPNTIAVSMAESDFSFDPRTLNLRRESGPSESGLSFDPAGQRYLCDYSRPVRAVLYSGLYLERNPFFPAPPQVLDAGNPATMVFPLAFAQGTNAGTIGTKKLPLADRSLTNQYAPAWMTSAAGLLVYRGTAFPTNYYGNAFVADRENHLIHRALLRDNGLATFTQTAPDERGSEFLASRDAEFRPVALVNGPDGGIYVADLNSGVGRGRIYRIIPTIFKEPTLQRLGKVGTNELVTALSNPNAWHHEAAARLIHTRQQNTVLPLLSNILYQSRSPLARLRAFNAIASLGALIEPTLMRGLTDPDERVRRWAVAYCQASPYSTRPSEALLSRLQALSADPSIRLRMQLAFTLGELQRAGRNIVLEGLLRRDLTNRWMQAAVLSSLPPNSASFFQRLGTDPRFRSSAPGELFLRNMARMFGVRGELSEATQALDFVYGPGIGPDQAFDLVYELGQGLRQTRSALAFVDAQVKNRAVYPTALNVATDEGATLLARIRSIRVLNVSPFTFREIGDWLLLLINTKEAPGVQQAAIQALNHMVDPGVATGLLQKWRNLRPDLRIEAAAVLTTRPERLHPLLSAMESGTVSPRDLSTTQLNFLRTHPDPLVSQRAVRLLGPIVVQRPDLLMNFRPALALSGSSPRGRELFAARCAACHRSSPDTSIGGALAGAKAKPIEVLLSDIFEPHRDVPPGSTTVLLETKDGETLIGIVTQETEKTVTLRQEDGMEMIIPRLNIGIIRPQAWSLMPQGLEAGLRPQDMADLLKYLAEIPWP
jgi:putative membrane-bound dehydrogenase-like protein